MIVLKTLQQRYYVHGNNFRCKILQETTDPTPVLIAISQDGRLLNGYVWLRIETSEDLL
jgi:hypothetical protein